MTPAAAAEKQERGPTEKRGAAIALVLDSELRGVKHHLEEEDCVCVANHQQRDFLTRLGLLSADQASSLG